MGAHQHPWTQWLLLDWLEDLKLIWHSLLYRIWIRPGQQKAFFFWWYSKTGLLFSYLFKAPHKKACLPSFLPSFLYFFLFLFQQFILSIFNLISPWRWVREVWRVDSKVSPMIPTFWYSYPCISPSPWVWARRWLNTSNQLNMAKVWAVPSITTSHYVTLRLANWLTRDASFWLDKVGRHVREVHAVRNCIVRSWGGLWTTASIKQ